MKDTNIKKEEEQRRSDKAPKVEHEKKEHLSRLVEKEARRNPMGGRFGKKWFPYNK